ncbi:DNA circularization protein [Chitiniphilus eburneus]|uniref:DNA circularization protein n=1 Tax=Chitiniphilus eburneus TaxID=2571148 RepID=UPI0035CFA38F
MAWADNLQDASWRGVSFDAVATQDATQRDLAIHQYPYVPGADIEDLGRRERRVSLRARLWGPDYDTRLQTLIAALDEPGPGELVHPVFGTMPQMVVQDYQIGHDADEPDACTIDLVLLEAATEQPFFTGQLAVQAAQQVADAAQVASAAATETFVVEAADTPLWGGLLGRAAAYRALLSGLLGQLRTRLRGALAGALAVLDTPRAWVAEVVGLLTGLVDLRSWDAATLRSDWSSLVADLDDVVRLPAAVAAGNTDSGTAGGGMGGGAGPGTGTGTGTGQGGAPIAVAAADLASVVALVQVTAVTTLADAAARVLAAEADTPTLPPQQVERIANDVRERVQQAIDTQRTHYPVEAARPVTEALRELASAVQRAAQAVIDARPPLTRRVVPIPGNLHLLAHHWYGDYTRAAELARLNPHLTNPNHLQPGDTLNAYAQ